MRKLLACVFVCLLLLALATPAGAQNDNLAQYISQQYDIPQKDLTIAERYDLYIISQDLDISVATWYGPEAELSRGMVGYAAAIDRYYTDQELSELLMEDRKIRQQEYEQLREQAGKFDVSLYQLLLDSADDQVHEVYILPAYQLTSEIQDQIRDLYREYDMEAPKDLQGQWGRVLPTEPQPSDGGAGWDGIDFDDGDTSVSPIPPDYTGEPTEIAQATPRDPDLPAQAPAIDPSSNQDSTPQDTPAIDPAPDQDVPVRDTPTIDPAPATNQPPWEFYTTLKQLHHQGYQEALTSLCAYLDSISVEYQVQDMTVTASVTTAQAWELDRPDVQMIGSQVYAEPDIVPLSTDDIRGLGNDLDIPARTGEAEVTSLTNDPGNSPWLWGGGLVGLLALGLFLVIKK